MLKLTNNINDIIDKFKNKTNNDTYDVEVVVKSIINDVKSKGDIALKKYTEKFDHVKIEKFLVDKSTLASIASNVEEEFYKVMEEAKENISRYHEKQKQKDYILFEDNGVYLGQKITPIERIGVYVPGGTAAYPSSVLMNTIPAKIAGCKSITMVTPPDKDGYINPYIAAAAIICGVDEVYTIGGAQAIGALAYGTKTIKPVDKIVGPGNIFVAIAKKLVYGDVDIDMIAGPSEILVIADNSANPRHVAADLLSQAEHDRLSSSILITTSIDLYNKVNDEIIYQSEKLERKEIIKESIINHSFAIKVNNIEEAIDISNRLAPEHLELMVKGPMNYLSFVKNAGSIFLGYNTPEPVGDYFGGTNHVLPTNSTARFFSALSVDSFIKKSSFIHYSEEAIEKNGEKIMFLAEKEGLTAHRNSIEVRLNEK